MKDKILFICFLLLLSISCQEQSSDLDDIMLQCYDTKYQEVGYDIKTTIEDYEKLLVKDGVLKDDSGKSYLEVAQKIASDKDFLITSSAFQGYDPWHKVDKETGMAVFECEYEMIQLLKEKDSKWQKVFDNFESPELKENPELFYQVMEETLSETDLNSYYFRLKMFQLFDMANSKRRNRPSLPPVSTD